MQASYRLCSRNPTRRRYVSPAGSDRSSGTLSHPWRTIRKALRASVPGQAVYVRAGTYPDWSRFARSGTARNPVSLRAYPGERPVLTGRLKIEGSYFCVKGLTFQGRTSANSRDVLLYVAGARHVEVLRNIIVNAAMSGIYVGDEGDLSQDVAIIGNQIRGNGTHDRLDHGIYLGHLTRGLIANNLVIDNRAIGIKVEPEADHVVVTQNTVADNGRAGIVVGGELHWSSSDNLVVNNIVAFNHSWGIRTYWEDSVGNSNLALRNLVYGNEDGAFWFPGGGMSAQRTINGDPRFVSSASYRLKAGSPAVNRAIPAYSMNFDLTGRKRPKARPDLGAFER